MSLCALVLALLLLLQGCIGVGAANVPSAASSASLTEWTVPTAASGPWGLALDQSGNCCWFVEYYANKLGYLDPGSGVIEEWTIPTRNANPYSLAVTRVAGKVMVWGTEFGSDRVFAFLPDSGTFLEYVVPHYNSGVGYVSIEPTVAQTRIWFTETLRNSNGEFVYDPKTKNVTLYEDYFPAAVGGGAYGVVAGSSSVWFAGFSSLVRWDRASQQYTIWPLPAHGTALGRFIALDSAGQVWYTQGETNGTSNDNFVGVLNGDLIQEWRLPHVGADPRGISINPVTGQPWVAERSPSASNGTIALLGNSSSQTFVPTIRTTVPSGGSPVILGPIITTSSAANNTASPASSEITRVADSPFDEYALGPNQPHDIIVDSNGNAWISEPGVNKIARLSGFGSNFALAETPPTISINLGKSDVATVTATSSSGYQGTVSLSTFNAPAGVSLSFQTSPLNVPVGGTATAKVNIDVASNAQVSNTTVILQGDDGNVVHTASFLLSVTNSTASGSQKPQCLIATATYGSTLSPEVEFLRGYRDQVLSTRMGWSFLLMFNAWYYSFSPTVADYINMHQSTRPIMQVVLTPLIGFLFVASELSAPFHAYPEVATFLSGIIASLMIGMFYLGLPLGLLARRVRLLRRLSAKPWIVALLGGLIVLVVGEFYSSPVLLMVSSSTIILSIMLIVTMLTKSILSRKIR